MKKLMFTLIMVSMFVSMNCLVSKNRVHKYNVGGQEVIVAEKYEESWFGETPAAYDECLDMLAKEGATRPVGMGNTIDFTGNTMGNMFMGGEWKDSWFYSMHSSATTDRQACAVAGVK